MAPTLYHTAMSPPCRAVAMVAKMIGLELNLVEVNLMAGEHLKPEFLKLNPCHTIPVLKDGELIIIESRAMCTYLVNKYAPENDQMYPRDPARRSVVDCYLQFDIGTLYKHFAAYYYKVYFKGAKEFDEDAMTALKEALAVLEGYMVDDHFLLGEQPGIVDVVIGTSLTGFEIFGFDLSGYPKVQAFYKRFTALPEYVAVQKAGVDGFKAFITAANAKRNA